MKIVIKDGELINDAKKKQASATASRLQQKLSASFIAAKKMPNDVEGKNFSSRNNRLIQMISKAEDYLEETMNQISEAGEFE